MSSKRQGVSFAPRVMPGMPRFRPQLTNTVVFESPAEQAFIRLGRMMIHGVDDPWGRMSEEERAAMAADLRRRRDEARRRAVTAATARVKPVQTKRGWSL